MSGEEGFAGLPPGSRLDWPESRELGSIWGQKLGACEIFRKQSEDMPKLVTW